MRVQQPLQRSEGTATIATECDCAANFQPSVRVKQPEFEGTATSATECEGTSTSTTTAKQPLQQPLKQPPATNPETLLTMTGRLICWQNAKGSHLLNQFNINYIHIKT